MMKDQRPRFLPSFLDLVRKEAEVSGWIAILPYVLLAIIAVSAAVAYFIPADFWSSTRWDVSTAVYAGLLTFDGLILALGWSAFARMYDVLLRDDFGKYLAQNDLLNNYLVHMTFMHAFQILAVVASGVGLITILLDVLAVWADRVILAVVIALTSYSIKQATSAVKGMNDLIWQATYFEINKPQSGQNKSGVRSVNLQA